jgi:hypothetical protein
MPAYLHTPDFEWGFHYIYIYMKTFVKITVTEAPVNDLNKIFVMLGFHDRNVRVNISVYIISECALEVY